jgi:catechol 2,3-dioxygenase-like lactoylglutathione lyase family enzyme
MELGSFSVSLAVNDIKTSRTFYENLGFEVIDGDEAQNWLMLSSDSSKIGLFQGIFEKNTLTFHPQDVRSIQRNLKSKNVKLDLEADESTPGPAYIALTDPDSNPILLDQH